mmetsp:Transcript_11775/g.24703  ORF Transcript_11775/g.24703 Transcript_11775/m.24703 type:complete len:329 (-) Transcript_11775:1984-2970(-)
MPWLAVLGQYARQNQPRLGRALVHLGHRHLLLLLCPRPALPVRRGGGVVANVLRAAESRGHGGVVGGRVEAHALGCGARRALIPVHIHGGALGGETGGAPRHARGRGRTHREVYGPLAHPRNPGEAVGAKSLAPAGGGGGPIQRLLQRLPHWLRLVLADALGDGVLAAMPPREAAPREGGAAARVIPLQLALQGERLLQQGHRLRHGLLLLCRPRLGGDEQRAGQIAAVGGGLGAHRHHVARDLHHPLGGLGVDPAAEGAVVHEHGERRLEDGAAGVRVLQVLGIGGDVGGVLDLQRLQELLRHVGVELPQLHAHNGGLAEVVDDVRQ